VVFDACEERARERGLRITGSEIVGLVPRQVLLDAGRHYLAKMGRPTGVPEAALVHIAIRTLGLNEVKPFDPKERIIEYRLNPLPPRLAAMSLRDFVDDLSSESPAPGGGSVSALAASCAAGLASMVAVLSHTKKGFEAKHAELDRIATRCQDLKDQMLAAVDADTAAFDTLLEAMRMPKSTPEEEAVRDEAMANATVGAAEVPLRVLEACPEIIELNRDVAKIGMQQSLSDVGVGAQVARAAAAGGYQNVCINLAGLNDVKRKQVLLDRADTAWAKTKELHALAEEEILVKLRQQA
jgi:glutamate formiminotransferase/formiminotetrahydrofolate cyclodeaminase